MNVMALGREGLALKPILLDLYCCQGGASAGYAMAGFEILGVDIKPQPRYPYHFLQADALVLLEELVRSGGKLTIGGRLSGKAPLWDGTNAPLRIAAAHSSPPCQLHTRAQKIRGRKHPDLIGPTRELLVASKLPYVIENVPGAPLRSPTELCGAMFGLRTYRHRLFESNVPILAPPHPQHMKQTVKMGRPVEEGDWYHAVGNFSNVSYVRRDLGAPWMNRDGLRESIPPVYAKFVGGQLMKSIEVDGRS